MFKTKLIFEWDENKRLANIKKHGLDFKDVYIVFEDKNKITFIDDRFNYGEVRKITIGLKDNKLLASICHTDRFGKIRIISFRLASKKERKVYYG